MVSVVLWFLNDLTTKTKLIYSFFKEIVKKTKTFLFVQIEFITGLDVRWMRFDNTYNFFNSELKLCQNLLLR